MGLDVPINVLALADEVSAADCKIAAWKSYWSNETLPPTDRFGSSAIDKVWGRRASSAPLDEVRSKIHGSAGACRAALFVGAGASGRAYRWAAWAVALAWQANAGSGGAFPMHQPLYLAASTCPGAR